MRSRFPFQIFFLVAIALAIPSPAMAKTTASNHTDIQFTPIVLKVMEPPQTFAGSDNAYHLVYEIKLSNATKSSWKVDELKVMNPKQPKKHLAKYSGAEILKRMATLGTREPIQNIGSNQSAILWIHLKFQNKFKVPDNLIHQLTVSNGSQRVKEAGGPTEVILTAPPIIGAPLKGQKWVAADGCCDSIRHVRAMLPVNGSLKTAQRYAIDWEQLSAENTIYSGDKFNVESYVCYGKEVISIADGTVTQAVDNLPNQVPGKLPDQITPAQADGNHVVVKIGPRQYALYAHLKPGSVTVKTGQKVTKGQVLGKVGNSGNTSEPHLHFHLMDGPSPLGSNGIPYLLDQFDLRGHIKSTEAFDKAAADGTPVKIHPSEYPGFHQNQLPLDQSVVHLYSGS